MAKQSWAETHGIAAKWAGPCPLCGSPIEVGDRIFKLPANRGSSWVCWDCRWPTAGSPSLESVRVKLRHRLALHQPIGLNKAEAALLAEGLDACDATGQQSDDLNELREWLRTSVMSGAAANLSMDDARTALITLDSVPSAEQPTTSNAE